jgi:hypothetical protein
MKRSTGLRAVGAAALALAAGEAAQAQASENSQPERLGRRKLRPRR